MAGLTDLTLTTGRLGDDSLEPPVVRDGNPFPSERHAPVELR